MSREYPVTDLHHRIPRITEGGREMETDEIITGTLPREGEVREQTLTRATCEECGEPATRKVTFLLDNARRNPASSAYGKDDCRWCSDAEAFACETHRHTLKPPQGHSLCSIFPCTARLAHMFLVWR